MRLLIQDRQSGKTTKLIYTSEATGFRIITMNKQNVEAILNLANSLGCIIPQPMTYTEYREKNKCKCMQDNGILIDELVPMLDIILDNYFNTHVYTATLTDDSKGIKRVLDER